MTTTRSEQTDNSDLNDFELIENEEPETNELSDQEQEAWEMIASPAEQNKKAKVELIDNNVHEPTIAESKEPLRTALEPQETQLTLPKINYQQEYKSPATKGTRTSLSILSFNAPFFTTTIFGCIPIPQINGKVLPANAIRLPILKQKITELNPDIFGLKEIWAKDIAADLIQYFGERGYNYLNLRTGWIIQVGGVMLFSKLPLIDSKKIYWSNNSFPIEWFGGKGAIAGHYKLEKEKFQLEEDKFITVATFHQPGGCSSNLEEKATGTSSYRRGQNFEKMRAEFLDHEWWQNPGTNVNCFMKFIDAVCNLFSCCRKKPSSNDLALPYHMGIIDGDQNLSVDCPEIEVQTTEGPKIFRDDRKLLSVSIGMSNNGFNENEIKYGWVDEEGNERGQLGFRRRLVSTQPINFEDPRQTRPDTKGAGKQRVTEKVEDAIEKKISTGTDRQDLKDVTLSDGTIVKGTSPQEPIRIIDGAYLTKDCKDRCDLTSEVINFDGSDAEGNPIPISDHNPLKVTVDITRPSQEPPSIYEASVPEKTNRRNPAEGCWPRVKRFFGWETSSPTLFTLKPSVDITADKKLENTQTHQKMF